MRRAKIEKMRDYQEKDFHRIRSAFASGHRRIVYQLPTGGGKTIVFGFVAKAVIESGAKNGKRKNVMVLAHRDNLVHQAGEAMNDLGLEYGIIAPGFTRSIDQIQLASVHTLIRRLDQYQKPDLIIIDECHHASGDNTWTKIVNHYDTYVLGVTATPCRLDGKGLGISSGGIFQTMLNGPTMSELIRMGNLTPLELYAPKGGSLIDTSEMHISQGDFDRHEVAEAVDKPVIVGSAVEHYRKICYGARGIAFCPTVQNAMNVAEEFNKQGIPAAVVTGEMSRSEQRAAIKALADGTIRMLTSVDVISEGTDVPVVEVGIMMRPTMSLSLYMQQAGRIMRKFPGKSKGFLLDMVGNYKRHGFPEADRVWSLDSDVREQRKKAKENEEESEVKTRQCEQCYIVHPPAPVCPNCGFVYKNGRIVKQIDGELKLISPAEIERINRMKAERRAQGRAQSLTDLYILAGKKGHKKGWAEYVYSDRLKRNGHSGFISKQEKEKSMQEAMQVLTQMGIGGFDVNS